MNTNDVDLTKLMEAVDKGTAQLPDFQRGWVWDDGRIKALIMSVIHNFPVGAAMFLEYGNESIHFKHKPIEGSSASPSVQPSNLILDGQQRLPSLYNAMYSPNPVNTKTDKGKEISRYYYLSIEKAIDPSADNEEIVLSVPANRTVKERVINWYWCGVFGELYGAANETRYANDIVQYRLSLGSMEGHSLRQ